MAKDLEVINDNPNALPAFLQDQMEGHLGEGVSSAAEDILVPLIYVLQAQSPQCNKRGPEYVQDAEDGSLWLRSSGLPAVSGDVGIKFQPCYFSKDFVEWKPQRGGFVGRHEEMPEDAEFVPTPSPQDPEKKSWVRSSNGNIVMETKYHIGFVYLPDGKIMPYVVPLSSSGLGVSKEWMFLINNKGVPGGIAPSYACFYRLKTKQTDNGKGVWMKLVVTDEGWVQSPEDFQRGLNLHKAFKAGEKAVDIPEEETSSSSAAHDTAM